MVLLKNIVVCFTLLLSFSSYAQISFHRIYTGYNYDYGYDLVQSSDTSYYLCGASSSFIDGPSQAFLMKTDSLGQRLWSYDYGGDGSEEFKALGLVDNFAIYAGGFTNSEGAGAYDAYISQLDLNGNILWDTVIGGTDWERVVDLQVMPDSGVIVVANTKSFGSGGQDWWMMRYDKSGSLLWEDTYGLDYDDEVKSCHIAQGFIYVSGNKYLADSNELVGVIRKLDFDGNEIWEFNTDTLYSENFSINSLDNSHDYLQYSGQVYSGNVDSSDLVMGSISLSDGLGSVYITDYSGYQNGNQLTVLKDSFNLFINIQASNSFEISTALDGKEDAFLYKFNYGFGFENFTFTYSKNGYDHIGGMIATNDGGLAYIGTQEFYTGGKASMCFVKMGPNQELVADGQEIIDDISDFSVFLNLNELKDGEVLIYPNPTKGILNIDSSIEFNSIELIDAEGRVVYSVDETQNTLNLQFLNKGIYYLRLIDQSNYIRRLKVSIE